MSNAAAQVPTREGPFERLTSLLSDDLARVEEVLAARLESDRTPLIRRIAEHLIGAGGKRMRPLVTLAAARLCGYEGGHHVRLAASVEFIHNATLLHDDVVDESARRRGTPTANVMFGNKPTVLVGDFLFARAFQLMVETRAIRVLEILSRASAVIVEGEILQLSAENDLSGGEDVYFGVIRAKTAALFEAAAEVGAVIAGADDAAARALATYGDGLGVAFQLADDLLDYEGAAAATGKNVGDDFREGKATLPVLVAHARGDAEERAFWSRVVEKREQAEGDLDRALAIMRRTGALAETRARALAEADRARAALAIFPPGPIRDAMADLAAFAVARLR